MEEDKLIEIITDEVIKELKARDALAEEERKAEPLDEGIPVGISNRHVHLCREHLDILFGPGYELQALRELYQPNQYAAKEAVTLVGSRSSIDGVRILFPLRSHSQVEISKTDAYRLGIRPPVDGFGGEDLYSVLTLVGPEGAVRLEKGVMLADRHIHMSPEDAERLGVKDGERVKVKTEGLRSIIFDNVLIRVKEGTVLQMHLDTDEANAALLNNGDKVYIVRE